MARPVTVLVAPGPEVTIHTPTLPVARAYPSARMSGALFVPDQNVPQLGVIGQLMVQVDSLTAGIAEQQFHAFALQTFHKYAGTGHFHNGSSLKRINFKKWCKLNAMFRRLKRFAFETVPVRARCSIA